MERKELSDSQGAAGAPRLDRSAPRPIANIGDHPKGRPMLRVERRDHARHTAHVIMEIRGRLEGPRVSEARGVTVDMSCGGALAVFDDQIPADPDNTFMVRFVDPAGRVIAPEFRWATALRAGRVRSDYVVAVKFRHPLPPAVLGKLLNADLAPAPQGHA